MPPTTRHSARVRLQGLAASVVVGGGYNGLRGGVANGKDEHGQPQCVADLHPTSVGGVGLGFHWVSHDLPYVCDSRDCAFEDGETVRLKVVTLVFVTVYKMDFQFCETKSSGWKLGLGLGLGVQGAVWTIANTRHP